MFLHSIQLYGIAISAYQRIDTDVAENQSIKDEAHIAIVFSCMALEAIVNEMTSLAEAEVERVYYVKHEPSRELLVFSEVMTALNDQRAKFLDRINTVKRLSTGSEFDIAIQPYQDLSTLTKIRNEIVHKAPTTSVLENGLILDSSNMKLREAFQIRGLLADIPNDCPDENMITLFDAIRTKAVTRWACNTVSNTVQQFKTDGYIDQYFDHKFGFYFHGGQFARID